VTQILKGFRGLLLSRAHSALLAGDCVGGTAAADLFSTVWATFGMRTRDDWTFLQFAMVLLNVIFIYMVAGLVFPDFFGEGVVDLKENFYARRGWFFSLGCGAVASGRNSFSIIDCRIRPIWFFNRSSPQRCSSAL